jgi:hypothetical protein
MAATATAICVIDNDVSPWAADGRAATEVTFSPDGGVSDHVVATAVAVPVLTPQQIRAGHHEPSDTENEDDDDGSHTVDTTDPRVARRRVRKLLKGTKICFESASPRDVVLVNAVESGCSVVHSVEKADLIWMEALPKSVSFIRGLTHQRINFLPGMRIAATKCHFNQLMARVARWYPGEFDFIPLTFSLPADREILAKHHDQHPGGIYVVKPDAACGGEGIFLTDNLNQIRHAECVVQNYLANPLTIGGLKFDFRLYVAVTSISPLRFYLHREGLGRMAVEPYEAPSRANFHKLNMHLTNYSLNKFSSSFIENTDAHADDGCTKRKASTAMRQLCAAYPGFDEADCWDKITELVGKTLGVVAPHVLASAGEIPGKTNYLDRCFQLLGFDVLLDSDFQPHLLEINSHPSLLTDAPIDMYVKTQVVQPLVRMIALDARVNRLADRAKRSFVAPTAAQRAEWEEQFTSDTGFPSCDDSTCAAITARYVTPLLPLLKMFIDACGSSSTKYEELSSTRFARLMKKIGVAGIGCPFSTPEIDLLFIKCLQRRGGGTALEFYDFVDALTGVIGDRLSPHTPTHSLQRLRDVTNIVMNP